MRSTPKSKANGKPDFRKNLSNGFMVLNLHESKIGQQFPAATQLMIMAFSKGKICNPRDATREACGFAAETPRNSASLGYGKCLEC